jgi:hypothetical protein
MAERSVWSRASGGRALGRHLPDPVVTVEIRVSPQAVEDLLPRTTAAALFLDRRAAAGGSAIYAAIQP